MTRNDIISLCSTIVGICALASAAGFQQSIDSIAPGWGTKVVAVLGLAGLVAGQIVRTLSNPSPPSGMVSVVTPSTNSAVLPNPTPSPPDAKGP
jgi:hypothetical protein